MVSRYHIARTEAALRRLEACGGLVGAVVALVVVGIAVGEACSPLQQELETSPDLFHQLQSINARDCGIQSWNEGDVAHYAAKGEQATRLSFRVLNRIEENHAILQPYPDAVGRIWVLWSGALSFREHAMSLVLAATPGEVAVDDRFPAFALVDGYFPTPVRSKRAAAPSPTLRRGEERVFVQAMGTIDTDVVTRDDITLWCHEDAGPLGIARLLVGSAEFELARLETAQEPFTAGALDAVLRGDSTLMSSCDSCHQPDGRQLRPIPL